VAKRPVVRMKRATAPSDDPGDTVERGRDVRERMAEAADRDRPVYLTIDDRKAAAQMHTMLAEFAADLGLRVRRSPKGTAFKIDRKGTRH